MGKDSEVGGKVGKNGEEKLEPEGITGWECYVEFVNIGRAHGEGEKMTKGVPREDKKNRLPHP